MARSKLLKVPYFTQPTDNTCQSTVLKMFATYLEVEIRKMEWEAIDDIVGFIDPGFPVLVAVSHANVEGHIVALFGAYDPSLLSKAYGKQRFDKGMCLQAGGEIGPGTAVRVDPLAASRQRKGDKYNGTFYLISASR